MDNNQESIFNMALAYLKRVDKILYLCNMSSLNGDISKWNNFLRAYYRELSIKFSDDEKEEVEGKEPWLIDINKNNFLNGIEINLLKNLKKEHANFQNINLLINNPRYLNKYRKQILFLLDALEIKLRGKMQEKGMGLPSKDDPRRAITRR